MTREEFRDEFVRLTANLSDLYIAKYLQVSLPTVGRWRDGVAAPHLIGRIPIIASLERLFE